MIQQSQQLSVKFVMQCVIIVLMGLRIVKHVTSLLFELMMENASKIVQQATEQSTLIVMEFASKIFKKVKDPSNTEECH